MKKNPLKRFKAEWRKFDQEINLPFDEKTFYFELSDNGEPIGYSKILINGGVGELKELLVKKKFRDRGYGKRLLDHFITFCSAKHCHKLILSTTEKHKQAKRLYSANGFRIETKRTNDRYHLTWYTYSMRMRKDD
jgi:ribosomal protein S18 acetylase RimI-like enzyme